MTTSPGPMRIVVDGSKCDGRGICALILPERIALDRWGFASLDADPIEDRKTLARASRAVRACPAQALSLVGPATVTTHAQPGVRIRRDPTFDLRLPRRRDRPEHSP